METEESPKAELIKEKSVFDRILNASVRSGFITGLGISIVYIATILISSLFTLSETELNFIGFLGLVLLSIILGFLPWLFLSFFLIVVPTIIFGNIFHYFQQRLEYKIKKQLILIFGIFIGCLAAIVISAFLFRITRIEYINHEVIFYFVLLLIVSSTAGYFNNLLFFNHLYGKNPESVKAQE